MDQSTIKAAVIQLYSSPFDLDKNYKNAETRIRAAAADGAVLAVLPEYHLSGWAPEDDRFIDVARRSEEFIGKYCALAAELQICIVPGTIITSSPNAQGELVNVAIFIDHHGNILSTYAKKNLWHPERDHLTAGISDPHIAFDSPFGKIGMLVCWDIVFPEAFRELIVQGAQLIIVPAFWRKTDGQSDDDIIYNPKSEETFLDSVIICRAFENTCAVIFCNTGGESEKFLGISHVAVPLIGSVARLPDGKEATMLADINFKVVKAGEAAYKIRADLAKPNWHYK